MNAACLFAITAASLGQVPDVNHLATFTDGLEYPARMAAVPGGGLYVTDPPNAQVVQLDAAGTAVDFFAIPEVPVGVAVHADGRVFVSRGDGQVGVYDPSFNLLGLVDSTLVPIVGPNDMAFDPIIMELYVADSHGHQVVVFEETAPDVWTVARAFGVQGVGMMQFESPQAVALNLDLGHVIVADVDNFRIQVFDTTGLLLFKFGYRILFTATSETAWFARSEGVDVDACGNIYVADALMGTVRVFDPAGTELDPLHAPLINFGTGPGELRVPSDLLIAGSDLFVVSARNSAVEAYSVDCAVTIASENPDEPTPATYTRKGKRALLHVPDNPFDIAEALRGKRYDYELDVNRDRRLNMTDLQLAVDAFGAGTIGDFIGEDAVMLELPPANPPHLIEIPNQCGRCHSMDGAPGGMLTVDGQENLCQSCHTGGALGGNTPIAGAGLGNSHPWGIPADDGDSMGPEADGVYELDLHLDAGNIRCGTCHNPHDQDTGAPYLRAPNAQGTLCMQCHRGEGVPTEHGGPNHVEYCSDCHDTHTAGGDNLFLIKDAFFNFFEQQTNPVSFVDNTISVGPGGYVDPDPAVKGICEACHEYPAGNPDVQPEHLLDPSMPLCSECHAHHKGFMPGLDLAGVGPGEWVGADVCAVCHVSYHADWAGTKHPDAWDDLEALSGQGANPACLPCHTVGFGDPTGFVDIATTPELAGVQCENCHGMGSDHALGASSENIVIDRSAAMCGTCHTGSHHPTFDEWSTSGHADSSEDAHGIPSCFGCHAPLGEQGEPPELLEVECVSCHDSHAQTGNDAIPNPPHDHQLVAPEIAFPTPSNLVDDATNPDRFNLCGTCHHSRGRMWTSTSRGPHHSVQGNYYLGEMPVPDGIDLVPFVASDHAGLQLQCNTCHMYTAPHEDGPPEVDAITGHSWAVNYEACVGCHDSAEAAEALVDTLHQVVMARIDAVKTAMGDPATWEYSCCGGPPEGPGGQDDIPDNIKQARFLVAYIEGDASYGVHNGGYTAAILDEAEALVGGTVTEEFFLGATGCSACHAETHTEWSATLHAFALQNLPPFGQTNPGCLPCHTVGFGLPNGYVDEATTPHLAGVQCENCHGSGGIHIINPNDTATQPVATLESEMCGACHTGSHHPTFDEWSLSGHATTSANAFAPSCFVCHAPLNEAGDTVLLDTECTACHDSHAVTGNAAMPEPGRDYQLLYPEVVFSAPSNFIADCTDPARFNLCGQCHHSRGRVWTATERGPHHSLQGNVLYGEMPMPAGQEATPLVNNAPSPHLFADLQCATCHMETSPHEDGPPEVEAVTGHEFEPTTGGCNSEPGCHTSEATAVAALGALQGVVDAALLDIETRLGDPATWEYSCCGGPPEGVGGQDDIPDYIKQVRYLYSYVLGDASRGAHNPEYVTLILGEAQQILTDNGL